MLKSLQLALREHASESDTRQLSCYFKTGPGEYGEGDRFIGVRVPVVRKIARKYQKSASLSDVQELLTSPVHEERLLALIILIHKYNGAPEHIRESIYAMYLNHTRYINNWDLVDTSAEHIVGAHLYNRPRQPLYELAASDSLWDRRIAIMATFHFIKKNEFGDTLKIAEMLVADTEVLIHKAVGWMLRETGKRDRPAEEEFLKKHRLRMPRTMLRYAIEKFPEDLRQWYLHGS
ncbi:DNA alkylation repair protein [Natronogracilivirga saccharolytica]|uniref:DNA alkylation repair protein n=1 Tax=Natronogracilivirga saccharolytica TaxID=2812953 RepID=A0A8J7RQH6_9BACT|nr:DNA alkylation repair protein [Natronogracilivirga saccharolytica]MBP3192059.1 DNA alkylation repair protein [Natronogracilivirga saccharolytica]